MYKRIAYASSITKKEFAKIFSGTKGTYRNILVMMPLIFGLIVIVIKAINGRYRVSDIGTSFVIGVMLPYLALVIPLALGSFGISDLHIPKGIYPRSTFNGLIARFCARTCGYC